jgi:predicted phosphodiesterase
MSKQKIEIIEAYLSEQQPGFFARTLARKIVTENPGLFDQTQREIEKVRKSIRYRTGSAGAPNLESAKVSGTLRPEFIREQMKPSEYMANFMQRGETTAKPDWHLPKHHRKVLVLSDLHIPYHDLPAIETAIDYGFKSGIDGIYLNGDVIDFAKISKWEKDPAITSAVVEVGMARNFFEGIANLGLDVYYKLGNHEERWERYILQNAPELHGLDGLQLKKALGLDDFEIELIDSKQVAKFGKLNVIHGHEFGDSIFSPVNPARGLFNRGKASVLAGHNHQTSEHQESNLDGSPIVCFSTGGLCDLRPAYRPFAFTKWNHGAAIVEIEEDGNFSVENFRIENRKVR